MTSDRPGAPGAEARRPDDADLQFRRTVEAAADAAFDRVLAGVEPEVASLPPGLQVADALQWAGDRCTELLAELAELPLEELLGWGDRDGGAPAGAAGRPPSSAPRGEPLLLSAVPGGFAEARLWVHLVADPPAGTLRFSLSDLRPADGPALPGELAVFAPAELTLPAPTGSATVLRYPVPPGTPPGRYEGLAHGRGVAAVSAPVTLVIT